MSKKFDSWNFIRTESVQHDGKVVVIAEVKELNNDEAPSRFVYNILDLEQGQSQPDADPRDQEHWGEFRTLEFAPQLREVGMGLVTVATAELGLDARSPLGWHVLSDNSHLYIFRAIQHDHADCTVVAARFNLVRAQMPEGVAAPLELRAKTEARFKRSGLRETPDSEKDSQSALDVDHRFFIEPQMNFGMLHPKDGRFAITILPSSESQSGRWHFFAAEADGRISSWTFVRDDNGWPQLPAAAPSLSSHSAAGEPQPDVLFRIKHASVGAMCLSGLPVSTQFKRQETTTDAQGSAERSLSAPRLMLAARMSAQTPASTDLDSDTGSPAAQLGAADLVTVDFGVDSAGLPSIADVVEIDDVVPARTALHFNQDRVITSQELPPTPSALSLSFWLRHAGGDAVLAERIAGEDINSGGFRLEWDAGQAMLRANVVLQAEDASPIVLPELSVQAPTSHVWHNLTMTFELGAEGKTAALSLFVDGAEHKIADVELAAPAQLPVGGQIVLGGPTGSGAGAFYQGDLDEVRFWNKALRSENLNLYSEISAQEGLLGYWKFNDGHSGHSTEAVDSSGNNYTAEVQGARWITQTAPVAGLASGLELFNAQALSSGMGRLMFKHISEFSDPSLLNASDGIVHLYASGQVQENGTSEQQALALQFDAAMDRAQFALNWRTSAAQDTNRESGDLLLIARQGGSAMNGVETLIQHDAHPGLAHADIEFKVPGGKEREKWRALPLELQKFCTILNGQAVDDPHDAGVIDGSRVFYDYDATVPLCLMRTNRDSAAYIISHKPTIDPVELQVKKFMLMRELSDSRVRVVLSAHQRNWNCQLEFNKFGDVREITRALAVLNGQDRDYDYAANFSFKGSLAQLQVGKGVLLFVSPQSTELEVCVAEDKRGKEFCSVTIKVTTKAALPDTAPGSAPESELAAEKSVIWEHVPRTPAAFIRVLNGRDAEYTYKEEQLAQVKQFVVSGVNLDALIPSSCTSQGLKTPAPAMFYSVVLNGASGTLVRQEVNSILQGVELAAATRPAGGGSWFFRAHVYQHPRYGAPASIVARTARLHQSGNFGGWAPEPPSVAGKFNGEGGATVATRPWSEIAAPTLAPPDDCSMEAWVKVDNAIEQKHARILTVNGPADVANSRYLLGLQRSEALHLSPNTQVIGKGKVRLLSTAAISIGFWLNIAGGSGDNASVMLMCSHDRRTALTIDMTKEFLTFRALSQNSDEDDGVAEDVENQRGVIVEIDDALRDTWQYCVFVFDPSAAGEELQIMLNNSRHVAPAKLQVSRPIDWLCLGKKPEGFPYNLPRLGCDAPMGSVTVWRRAIVASEVSELRKTGGFGSRDIVGFWDFGSVNGQRLSNLVQGGPQWDLTILDEKPKLTSGPGYYMVSGSGERFHTSSVMAVMPGEWAHIAAVCRDNGALRFRGREVAGVKNSANLSGDQTFSIDTTFSLAPDSVDDGPDLILAKSDERFDDASYVFGIRSDDKPFLRFAVRSPKQGHNFELVGTHKLERDRGYYFAAGAVLEKSKLAESPESLQAELKAFLFVQDLETALVLEPAAEHSLFTWKKPEDKAEQLMFQASECDVTIGGILAKGRAAASAFSGILSSVRFWRKYIRQDAKRLAQTSGIPAGISGPTANWRCAEGRGKKLIDHAGGLDASLPTSEMWCMADFTSDCSMFVNAQPVPLKSCGRAAIGGPEVYGAAEAVSIGALPIAAGAQFGLNGTLDNVRLWNKACTLEELRDSMHVELSGAEDALAAYWHFSTGSGILVKDGTGNGADLKIKHAGSRDFWINSTAPLSNEAPQVRNALHGRATTWVKRNVSSPLAVEYGDMQTDTDGAARGVMKRCYIWLNKTAGGKQNCEIFTDFKVGDLDLHFMGQVQTSPTLIGFIEGAPPVPSENLTRPYHELPLSPAYQAYDGVSSITLLEADEVQDSYSAEAVYGAQASINIAGGPFADAEAQAGQFFYVKAYDIQGKVGPALGVETSGASESGAELVHSKRRTRSSQIGAGGGWEDPTNLLNADLGRRYTPDNLGCAIVKSAQADLYALRLRKTGTMIDMRLQVDPHTSQDYNVIMFPLAADYTKQGSLDGMVGFVRDPDCGAEGVSYFKPEEAAQLEAKIAAQEAALDAEYDHFEPLLAMMALSPQRGLNSVARKLNKRNMVNSYVWTADGGFFAEEQQTMATQSESLGSSFNFSVNGGVTLESTFSVSGVGLFLNVDAMAGMSIERHATRTRAASSDFELDVNLEVESFLEKYVKNPQSGVGDFNGENTPGKVTAYRFKSFYLAPENEHYSDFFSKVVDPNWLFNSSDPHAIALRQVRGRTNPVWRILHRVTYVQRVPAQRGVPVAMDAKPAAGNVHVSENRRIIALVSAELQALGILHATPAQIGAALRSVIFERMPALLPWWPAFLKKAEVAGSQAQKDLTSLQHAALWYLNVQLRDTPTTIVSPRLESRYQV